MTVNNCLVQKNYLMKTKDFCCFGMFYISANSCYFTSAKQQVKQLANDALSGRNSLSRKQMKAGSLANLLVIPSSEFEVCEMREAATKSDHIKKEGTLKDDRLVEREVICEYLCPLEKNITCT